MIRPTDSYFLGTVYPDGSLLDGNEVQQVGRLGWGFAVVNNDGVVIASAHGRPPEWITDTAGAEAWAIPQPPPPAPPLVRYRRHSTPSLPTITNLTP